ncbi:unnamed protein product [Ectocarpus sp. CCAP 1310/34]|nr:unnamed protein product [Ectocarpus sp. CCAP 1310/34]
MASLKRSAEEALDSHGDRERGASGQSAEISSYFGGPSQDEKTPKTGNAPPKKSSLENHPAHQGGQLHLTGALPKLVVLDLDKTVWPVYCHEETRGPYTRGLGNTHFCNSESTVKCSSFGREKVVRLFPDVVALLRCLQQQGSIRLAVASRSPVDEGGAARGILGALGLLDLFCCLEIHTGSKAKHFQNIHAATGVEYREMLFFDDEKHNIKTVRRLGVTCVKVSKESGLTFAAVNAGLKKYREACLSRSSLRGWFTPVAPKEDSEHPGQARRDSAHGPCIVEQR